MKIFISLRKKHNIVMRAIYKIIVTYTYYIIVYILIALTSLQYKCSLYACNNKLFKKKL